jgi:hypothetical protein
MAGYRQEAERSFELNEPAAIARRPTRDRLRRVVSVAAAVIVVVAGVAALALHRQHTSDTAGHAALVRRADAICQSAITQASRLAPMDTTGSDVPRYWAVLGPVQANAVDALHHVTPPPADRARFEVLVAQFDRILGEWDALVSVAKVEPNKNAAGFSAAFNAMVLQIAETVRQTRSLGMETCARFPFLGTITQSNVSGFTGPIS